MKPTRSSKTPKVVLDTNVILSGILYGGNSLKLLDAVQNDKFTLCTSEKLLDEVYDKLVNKFQVEVEIIEKVETILSIGKIHIPQDKINFPKDPKDAYLLELVKEADADFLITGDKKHLLPLKSWQGTKIVSPLEAVDILC